MGVIDNEPGRMCQRSKVDRSSDSLVRLGVGKNKKGWKKKNELKLLLYCILFDVIFSRIFRPAVKTVEVTPNRHTRCTPHNSRVPSPLTLMPHDDVSRAVGCTLHIYAQNTLKIP